MADPPNNSNDGNVFKHFPCYKDWSSQRVNGATIDNYHDALYNLADEINFKGQHLEDAFKVFQYLAHLENLASMYSYGFCIVYGQGTDVDRTAGFAWVEKSAKLGFAKAQGQLAVCLSKGIGCEQNGVEALHWAQSAINQGFADAHSTIGSMYFEGTGVPVNHANAIEHYRLGMDAGSVECISQLGLLYQKGTGVEKDVKKAVELFEKAVSLGCSLGCYYLGTLHEDGYDGILKDLSKAATFFEQAVQLEDGSSAAAKRNLARLYDKGIGVEQSHELSLQYYLEAAKFEDAWALYTLGLKYANGTGVEQDYSIAFEFYERAAKQNNAAAMSNLGYLLGESRGCAKDSVRAAEFFQQSAALGDGFGAYNCGVVFQDGKGVPVNLFKAVDYYRMAVRLKYEGAEACLGPTSKISRKLFMAGTDLEAKDKDKEAIDHFYAAAVQGHSESVRIVTALFRYGGGPEKMSYEKEMRYFKPPEAPDSTLSAAPTEILLQIFQWLHPKECVLLRHISRRIWTLFDDDSAPRHLFNFHSHFLPPADMGERHWFDKMLFQGPRAFQAAYLEMKLNTVQKVNRYYGKYISLRGSRMNTFPAVFCNWTSVTSIDLNSSGLVGPIPDSIKYFRSLKELVLSYNCFDGTEIPASMMELTQLEVLMLTQCELTGALSVEICQFLKTLKLYSLLHNRLVVPGGVRFELYYNSKQRKRRQRRKVLAEE